MNRSLGSPAGDFAGLLTSWLLGYTRTVGHNESKNDCARRAEARRSRITIRKTRMGSAEEDRLDREFWAQLTPDERLLETWRLSLELWQMRGWDQGESRLHRSIARTLRR